MRNQRQENRIRICEKAVTVVSLVFLMLFIFQGKADCQLKSFVPTITNWFGDVEINATYESNTNTYLGNGTDVSKIDLSEKATLGFSGFIYHPRFAIFNLSIGVGIQESYTKSEFLEGWDFGTVEEYEVKVLFLPYHHYSAELFSRRRNPFIQGRLIPGLNPLFYEHGINLFYQTRPLTLNLSYTLENLRISNESTDIGTLRFGGNHTYKASKTIFSYTRTDSDSTTRAESTIDNLNASNKLVYRDATLNSNILLQKYDQVSPGGLFTDRTIDWMENLTVKVTEDLSATGRYNIKRIDREKEGLDSFFKTINYGAGLLYRFYDSITARYNFSNSRNDSTSSASEKLTHSQGVNYRKRIRYGMFYASYSGRSSDTVRTGPLSIFNESHEAGLFPPDDRFSLDETGVDEESISLDIVEPGTGRIYDLEKDVHYLTDTIGNQTFITLISVSGISPLIFATGPFIIRADYNLPEADTAFETTINTFSTKLELFQRRLVTYYSLRTNKQIEIEREIPGGAEDSRTQTIGLALQRKSLTLSGEYQEVESRINPMTVWRIRGDYYERYSERKTFSIKTLYQTTEYQEVESDLAFRTVLKEDLFTLNARANFIFPRRNITMYAGPNFSYRKGEYKSYGIGLSAGLNWKMGLLDLNTGLSFKHLVSQLTDGDIVSQNIYFYFRAARELF